MSTTSPRRGTSRPACANATPACEARPAPGSSRLATIRFHWPRRARGATAVRTVASNRTRPTASRCLSSRSAIAAARRSAYASLVSRARSPVHAIERETSRRIVARRFVSSSNCLTTSRSLRAAMRQSRSRGSSPG